MATQFALFDVVRIDHFRGFESCWEIPEQNPTAEGGQWIKVPGDALFDALCKKFSALPLVAEDLGIITPEVDALREKYHLPGMKILQFAFEGGPTNPYLPHNHKKDSVHPRLVPGIILSRAKLHYGISGQTAGIHALAIDT